MKYALTVWDPSTKQLQHELNMVKNGVIRFICELKGRDSVTEALEKLDVQTLGERRKTSWRNLLLRFLSSEENQCLLIDSYDERVTTKNSIPVTRAVKRCDPPTIYAKSSGYHNSFLPKIVREFKANFS